MISVIIPVVRERKAGRTVQAVQRASKIEVPVEIIAMKDNDGIGCPRMVSKLVAEAKHPWICFLGDDTIPQPDFLYEACVAADTLPDTVGVVGLNDQTNRFACTHFLAHRGMLEALDGEFFHSGYTHCFCDDELRERALRLGRFAMAWRSVVYHDHPVLDGGELGEYERLYRGEVFEKDKALFMERRAKGWRS